MKVCKSCGKLGRKKSFYISYMSKGKAIYSSECKKCCNKRIVEYRRNNKERAYATSIKHLYGITTEDYNRMLVGQDYKCKICNGEETHKNKKKFNIDYCHKTGKVRGLLCNRCNVGLGKFKDSVEILTKAIDYLLCKN